MRRQKPGLAELTLVETAMVGVHQVLKRGAPLAAQWLRTCLAMRGIPVLSLGWEDPACRRAARPLHHHTRACAREPASLHATASAPAPSSLCCVREATARSPHTSVKGAPLLSAAGEACTAVRTQHGREYKKSSEKKYHDVIPPTPVASIS